MLYSDEDWEAWKVVRGICSNYKINLQGWEKCKEEDLYYLAERIVEVMIPNPQEAEDGSIMWDEWRGDKAELTVAYYELLKRIRYRLI